MFSSYTNWLWAVLSRDQRSIPCSVKRFVPSPQRQTKLLCNEYLYAMVLTETGGGRSLQPLNLDQCDFVSGRSEGCVLFSVAVFGSCLRYFVILQDQVQLGSRGQDAEIGEVISELRLPSSVNLHNRCRGRTYHRNFRTVSSHEPTLQRFHRSHILFCTFKLYLFPTA